MSPIEGAIKELDEKYVEIVGKFVSDIKIGKLEGSLNIALATVSLLEQIITESQNASAFELCGVVRGVGARLAGALSQHSAPALMVRRVLRAIRDENRAAANLSGEGAGESLQRLVLAAPSRRATLGPAEQDLREPIRDQIAELRAELESSTSSICSQAPSHIHADEVVLTYGANALVERFLRAAGAGRDRDRARYRYRLIVAEGPDVAQSQAMCRRLGAAGVPVWVVPGAAVFALMSRVNKVIVGVEAAAGGGAALGAAGLRAVALAATHYSVPVVALAPLHALSPSHACHHAHCAPRYEPAHTPLPLHYALPYEHAESGVVHAYAPKYDYVSPDLITLFITNLGGSSPSYIYRLLSELYDPKDNQL